MAYSDVAELANDEDFVQRVAAAGQTEGRIGPGSGAARQWAMDHVWTIAASPGFGDAYAAGKENGIARPGYEPSVISDNQILAAVQAIPVETPT